MSDDLEVNRRVRYVVAQYGDLNRGEHLNIAVLAWDTDAGPSAPVVQYMLRDWTRVHAAFPSGSAEMLQWDVTARLQAIKTYEDFCQTRDRMGPYTPFQFTEERGSIESPEKTATSTAKFFLQQDA